MTETEKITTSEGKGKKIVRVSEISTSSPLYLHPSEGPGSLITMVQLKGDNYEDWSKHVRNALRTKRKLGFIDGTLEKPVVAEEIEQWEVVNSMIVAWLMNTVEPTLRTMISIVHDSHILWEDLRLQFSVGNGPRKIWDDLAVYKPLKSCSCGELAAQLEQERDEERTRQFLMGLDDRVVRDERQQGITRNKEDRVDAVGFAVQSGNKGKTGEFQYREKDVTCTHCGKYGHAISDCFQIKEYPDWWDERGRNYGEGRGDGNRGGRGLFGRGGGMVGSFGRGRGSHLARANVAQTHLAEVGTANSALAQPIANSAATARKELDRASLPQLNDEQITFLIRFLNQQKTAPSASKLSGKTDMIIDSGASHHMTLNIDLLSDVQTILPCAIRLPGGDRAMAEKQGWMCLGGDIRLNGVLYSPDLTCSLISVAKLLKTTKVSVTFTEEVCVLQDRTLKIIGAGEECDGVYKFRGILGGQANKTTSSDQRELWHRRLGHPSDRVLSYLSSICGVGKTVDTDGAFLPVKFWGECVLSASHLINRTPTSLLQGKTSYEMLYGKPPSFDSLKVFGCLAYAPKLSRDKDKFGERSRKCVFLGYPYGKKGWTMYDLEKNDFFVSRDVQFHEMVIPFAIMSTTVSDIVPYLSAPLLLSDDDFRPTPQELVEAGERVSLTGVNSLPSVKHSDGSPRTVPDDRGSVDAATPVLTQEQVAEPQIEQLGRGHRQKMPSKRLQGYEVSYHSLTNDLAPSPSSVPATSSSSAAISAEIEPDTYEEAMQLQVWRDAVKFEVDALEDQHTWDVGDLPPGKTAIGCRFVFKIKYNSDGTIERHKARLVVMGNQQKEGNDYKETFAPVVKLTTVRMVLKVAAVKNWIVHQMDVHNAFLHGDLEEEVYMKLPPGFKASGPNQVCKLRKSLYGLKQAPRCWFSKLTNALLAYGFSQSYADYSLFALTRGKMCLYVIVYVDDLLIGGNDADAICRFKGYLNQCFHIKDLGSLKYFLGVEVARSSKSIYLSQWKYVLDIINECGLLGGRPTVGVSDNYSARAHVHGPCAFSVLAPTSAALRVVRYLKNNPSQGILYTAMTKKQSVVSQSSAEAEYRAMAFTAPELTWIRGLLADFGVSSREPFSLYCDNKAALHIAANPIFHERTKTH
ncbi:PREDICTED: uncharacterized protein LOC109127378 [Camelina sativa]|uniref:Uncharacterized protein LOC109127378 n=1 Tax=Camelina sativa TaxID=90675 RepID=A0ABM1QLB1_CAMSA|nr:PREDICTED: uncharacterized protein LOC109127378 [Camelina sativa]